MSKFKKEQSNKWRRIERNRVGYVFGDINAFMAKER
jgi:hypothetical protein